MKKLKFLILVIILIFVLAYIPLTKTKASETETSCTWVRNSSFYTCGKALIRGMHIQIKEPKTGWLNPARACDADVLDVDIDILARVKIKEDIKNCRWSTGTEIQIMWSVGGIKSKTNIKQD